MQRICITFLLLFVFSFASKAQVAIGTTNIPNSALLYLESTNKTFVPPQMSEVDMLGISHPLEGSIVFNTTKQFLYVFKNNVWSAVSFKTFPTLVLNKRFSYGQLNAYMPNNGHRSSYFNSSNIIHGSNTLYQISGNKIIVKESGTYLLNGLISVYNMPTGNRKFVLMIKKGNDVLGYISRGTIDAPENFEWTSTGSIILKLDANDVIDMTYTLNGLPLTGTSIKALDLSIVKVI